MKARNQAAGKLIQPFWLDKDHTVFLGPLPLDSHGLHGAILELSEKSTLLGVQELRRKYRDDAKFVAAMAKRLSKGFGTKNPKPGKEYAALTPWCLKYGMPRELLGHLWVESMGHDLRVVGSLLPPAGVSYGIRASDKLSMLYRALPYIFSDHDRLADIRQLAALSLPLHGTTHLGTEHTRLLHQYDVLFLMHGAVVLNHLPPKIVNELLVSGFGHDVKTPAWGDTVKLIAPDVLNEDRNFDFSQDQCAILEEKLGVDADEVIKIVQGDAGWKSDLLSFIDRVAYVARDMTSVVMTQPNETVDKHHPLFTINFILGIDPYVCGVWDAVMVDTAGDRIFIDDKNCGRIFRFLNARTAMVQGMYLHPSSRKSFNIVLSVLGRYLYRSGKLSFNDLLSTNDQQLLDRIKQIVGISPSDLLSDQEVQMEAFKTREEALEYQSHLLQSGESFVLAEDVTVPAANTGMKGLNLRHDDGLIMPLEEVGVLQDIQRMVWQEAYKDFPFIRVFHISTSLGNHPLQALFEEIRKFRLGHDPDFCI